MPIQIQSCCGPNFARFSSGPLLCSLVFFWVTTYTINLVTQLVLRIRTDPSSVFYVVDEFPSKIMQFLWVNAHLRSYLGRAYQYQFNSIVGRYLSITKLLLLQNNCPSKFIRCCVPISSITVFCYRSMSIQVHLYGRGIVQIQIHFGDIASPYPSEFKLMLLWGKKTSMLLMHSQYRSKIRFGILRVITIKFHSLRSICPYLRLVL